MQHLRGFGVLERSLTVAARLAHMTTLRERHEALLDVDLIGHEPQDAAFEQRLAGQES